jgi:branched-chain amino acid transport system permease protein
LIYGFNGQFSLGQWGFYAIGAYTAADITFRWHQMHTAQALVVALLVVIFAGIAFFIVGRVVKAIKDFDVLSIFALYLVVTVFFIYLAVMLGQPLTQPVTAFFSQLPPQVSMQVIFILAVLIAGVLAAEVSFIFGLPVLTLGSDYFGIATLALQLL